MATTNAEAEALIPQFKLNKFLNQDQAGRRLVLLGSIQDKPALLVAERAAFSAEPAHLESFTSSLANIKNLGANDIYFWFLAATAADPKNSTQPPDLKLNLIWPCNEKHIRKYSQQGVRIVTETPEIYRDHVRPYMQKQREEGRLNWVFNIIEGRTEQEDVFFREHGEEGFLVLPDLNWDRKTMASLHLLGLVERRDIWSVRDLRKTHITWLKHMRAKLLDATVKLYPELERDQLKLYIHYQPTYYHFHVHIVHVALEAGATQATGKALGLENIISQLEHMAGPADTAGMADLSLTYTVGEASELWTEIFEPLRGSGAS
ncbi:hypothetical protein SLS58_003866 [Diplodia intermedia]|uniref:Scavenger mRNA decapping enzyme n=1 Tax=Diplodia intermedia TaxID=856260 RepID=A0ABR3TVH7_9PEZI